MEQIILLVCLLILIIWYLRKKVKIFLVPCIDWFRLDSNTLNRWFTANLIDFTCHGVHPIIGLS